jgi:hypothetical protein
MKRFDVQYLARERSSPFFESIEFHRDVFISQRLATRIDVFPVSTCWTTEGD